MIGKIYFNNLNFASTPSFKSSARVTHPCQNLECSFNGTEAIANYNRALLNRKNAIFDIPKIEKNNFAKDVNTIEGEKIYDSNGKLVQIIDENNFVINKYTPTDNGYEYEVIDKKSNKKIFSQICLEEEHNKRILAVKYENGYEYGTWYNNEIPERKFKLQQLENGSNKAIEYDFNTKEYNYMDYDAETTQSNDIIYDENKKIINFDTRVLDESVEHKTHYNIHNGQIYSKEDSYLQSCSDTALKYPLYDKDLTPLPKPNYETDISNISGFETYYSNGEIESITTNSGAKYTFPLNKNEQWKIEDGNKTIYISENDYIRVEEQNGKNKKTTSYYKDECHGVSYSSGGFEKALLFEHGKPTIYQEFNNGECTTQIYYDRNGNAIRKTI